MAGRSSNAFTLAELLIALAILGVIATFAIPKVLQVQQDAQKLAKTKELIAMVAESYYQLTLTKGFSPTTCMYEVMEDRTNYLKQTDTGGLSIDDEWGDPYNCNLAGQPCYLFPSGAIVRHWGCAENFVTASNNQFISFLIDPDGKPSGEPSVQLFLYYNGRITSKGNCYPGSTNYLGWVCNPGDEPDPTWFKWD